MPATRSGTRISYYILESLNSQRLKEEKKKRERDGENIQMTSKKHEREKKEVGLLSVISCAFFLPNLKEKQ